MGESRHKIPVVSDRKMKDRRQMKCSVSSLVDDSCGCLLEINACY